MNKQVNHTNIIKNYGNLIILDKNFDIQDQKKIISKIEQNQ